MADGVDLTPPTPEVQDTAHALAKGVISAVPWVGGPVAELFGVLLPATFEKRQQAWFELVAEALEELRTQGVDLEMLAADEGFVTIVVEATKAALGTHLEEKVRMLARCLVSCALPDERDDLVAMRLLRYVDELSPEHFVVLTYLNDPVRWYDERHLEKPNLMAGPPRHLLDRAGLGIDAEPLGMVLEDLNARGLADTSVLGAVMTNAGAWACRSTDRGRLLLNFVRAMDGPGST